MVKIVFMEEYQEKYDNIKKWYVQQVTVLRIK